LFCPLLFVEHTKVIRNKSLFYELGGMIGLDGPKLPMCRPDNYCRCRLQSSIKAMFEQEVTFNKFFGFCKIGFKDCNFCSTPFQFESEFDRL